MSPAVVTDDDLHLALSQRIGPEPRRVVELLTEILNNYSVDREEVVAALWDLVEDEGLIYDATATVRRA